MKYYSVTYQNFGMEKPSKRVFKDKKSAEKFADSDFDLCWGMKIHNINSEKNIQKFEKLFNDFLNESEAETGTLFFETKAEV